MMKVTSATKAATHSGRMSSPPSVSRTRASTWLRRTVAVFW